MIMSVVFGFIPAFLIFQEHENHALWYGLLMFLACRGIFLGLAFYRLASKDGFKLLN
jgi:Na+-driven multidrug efflux pump